MSELTQAPPPGRGAAANFDRNVVKGLLWREWLVHRRWLMVMLCLWLIGQWILPMFWNPWVVLVFGAVFALWIGAAAGGFDAAEGSEEFSFALPATRGQRYLVSMALGGSAILLLTGASLLAIGLDLPQRLWGIFVNSGFTEPCPPAEGYTYALAFSVPVAAFAFSFAIAALERSRGFVLFAGLLGAVCAGAILGLGLLCERWLWGYFTGMVCSPALLALGAAGLFAGYLRYLRKEGISRPTPFAGAGGRWLWLVLGIAVFVILAVLFLVGVRASHVSETRSRLEAARAVHESEVIGPEEAMSPPVERVLDVMPPSTRPAATSAAARKE